MQQSQQCAPRLRELIDTDVPPDELERLARVDAPLRASAHTEAPCEQTRAAISAALDHELSEFDSIRVRKHVERVPPAELSRPTRSGPPQPFERRRSSRRGLRRRHTS